MKVATGAPVTPDTVAAPVALDTVAAPIASAHANAGAASSPGHYPKSKADWLAWKPTDDTAQVAGLLKQLGHGAKIPASLATTVVEAKADAAVLPAVPALATSPTLAASEIPEPRPMASQLQVAEQPPAVVGHNRFLDNQNQPSSTEQPTAAALPPPQMFPPPASPSQMPDVTARGLADFQTSFGLGSAQPALPEAGVIQSAMPTSGQSFGATANDAAILKQFSPDQIAAVQSLLARQKAMMSSTPGLAPLRAGSSQLQFGARPVSKWKPPQDDANAVSGLLSKVQELTGRRVSRPQLDLSGKPAFMQDLDDGSDPGPVEAPAPKKIYDWGTILGAAKPK